MTAPLVRIKQLGVRGYPEVFEAMRIFTQQRQADTVDEIWLVQHLPVYTLGLAGDKAHLLDPQTAIPVEHVDRGGQITYHGPGQCVAYLLFDLRHFDIYVKEFVSRMEEALIELLKQYGLASERREGAPGIYLLDHEQFGNWRGAKIAALGLKVTQHCTYHGLALNVAMDLDPFNAINPCGYPNLKTVDLKSLGVHPEIHEVFRDLIKNLAKVFQFTFNEIE